MTRKDWCLYRICGGAKPAYHPTKADWTWLEWFVKWAPWYLAGCSGKRPDAPKPIPSEAWELISVKCVHTKYAPPKKKPPPPPPPPPKPPAHSRWTDPPLMGKVVYFAWGLESGQFTPDSLAAFAARCNARAAAVEITDGNFGMLNAVKVALHARGIAFLVWERSDQKSVHDAIAEVQQLGPDGYLADVEGPMKDPTFAEEFAKAFPNLYRSLCATGSLDNSIPGGPQAASAPWIANGWDLAMQDYQDVNSNANPAGEDNFAYWRGWPLNAIAKRHFPVLEVEAEGSRSFAAQKPTVDGFRDDKGRLCCGLYLAEEATDDDVVAFAAA